MTTLTSLKLSEDHLAELDRARHQVRRSWIPLLCVGRDDFPLQTLGPLLDGIACDLDREPGHVVVSGIPSPRSKNDLRLILWGLGRHLGIAVPQDTTGRLVRWSDTVDDAFRSGGSDVTALLSVDHRRSVGLVSTRELYDEIACRRPDLAELLFVPVPFAAAGESGYRMLPLACWTDGRLSLRYDRDAIERAQRDPGAPASNFRQRELLDLIDALLPQLERDIILEAGDLLLVNNHEVLHSLRPCGAGLLRLWLTLREGRLLSPSYLWPTPTYAETGGRGGVTPRDVIH
jgi:hypothetical protein